MLSEEELEKWEAGRDLLKEIEDGIDEMAGFVDENEMKILQQIFQDKKKVFDALK
jgi:hypothetical protein